MRDRFIRHFPSVTLSLWLLVLVWFPLCFRLSSHIHSFLWRPAPSILFVLEDEIRKANIIGRYGSIQKAFRNLACCILSSIALGVIRKGKAARSFFAEKS